MLYDLKIYYYIIYNKTTVRILFYNFDLPDNELLIPNR